MCKKSEGEYRNLYCTTTSNTELVSSELIVNVDKSGANRTDLVEGLIPVVYDESTSNLVKADSKNLDEVYFWYDYDNKLWANATTQVGYNIARLGDATGEIILSSENTWYNDIAIVPYYGSSWFVRGGLYSRGANGEIFNFYSANGNYTTGYSSRTVIFIR